MSDRLHVYTSFPDSSLFGFPPTNAPAPIPPPPVPTSIMRPFNIPDHIFTAVLNPMVPLTIAAVYAVTVKSLSAYNRSHGKKPWAISKTRPFFVFVVAHNIFLAVYSAWTFWGMLGGMRKSILNPRGPAGLAGTADSFCRLHGSPGIGNSVYYNEATRSFISDAEDAAMVNGLPDVTQGGRMYTEGLAYYGWIFYLSKFYEVLDTFIIIAKGKPSSTLQTYHHAGAMLCMWAGMRFMSSPIWVFVLVNSFIHSLMYFYYTVTAFSIKVPTLIKRTLTSMQITQFLLGGSSAFLHSFISYTVPVPVPAAAPAVKDISSANGTETQTVTQACIVTAGETFAIWLNVLYLAPLTYLFVSFFLASYVKRSNAAGKAAGRGKADVQINAHIAEEAGWDAAKGLEKEVYGGEKMLHGGSGDEGAPTPTKQAHGKANNGNVRRRA